MELSVIKFIQDNKDWKELLTKEPYCITIDEDEDYYLLKYNQIDSDFTLPIVQDCRGLILRKSDLTPVALSFRKFFNVQEPNAHWIDWKSAVVQEKVDGSKILVWFDKKWHISTSGMLDAFKANVSNLGFTYGDVFLEALHNNNLEFDSQWGIYEIDNSSSADIGDHLVILHLIPNYCYTFELVSQKTKVVIPYAKTTLYYLSARDIDTLEELPKDNIEIAKRIQSPKVYQLASLSACLDATNRMGFDEEGFVVVDKFWNRVKIKSPAYVAAHHLRSSVLGSRAKVLELIEKGEQDEFLSYYPEYTDVFTEMKTKYETFKSYLYVGIADIANSMVGLPTQKERAEFINDNYPAISTFLFKFLKTDIFNYFIANEWSKLPTEKKLAYLEKPLGNISNSIEEDFHKEDIN